MDVVMTLSLLACGVPILLIVYGVMRYYSRARPLSSVPLFVAGFPACDPVLWPKGGDVLMRRHCGANGGKGYSALFSLRGWAISRQSKSPRARP